jgi:hypothetical protein
MRPPDPGKPPRSSHSPRWLRRGLLLGILAIATACRKADPNPAPATGHDSATPASDPSPAPKLPSIPFKKLETARLFSGIQINTEVQADFGSSTSVEREAPGSYALNLQLKVRVPQPHRSLPELSRLNPALPHLLPSLETLLAEATISPIFEELYQRKVANVQSNLSRLDQLLSRHNFFDTETILELQHPNTRRRALLVQADMDVDTDGSDGDRAPNPDATSSTFQPFTSYRWVKTGKRPNPFLSVWEKKLRDCEKELASITLPSARKKELTELQTTLKAELSDLKTRSFLVGNLDPYVVLPLPMVSKKGSAPAAQIGDFCVVLHGSRLYPAIVGDAGPSMKSGEASLRLCREISHKSGSGARAESDLKVTYLVFPGTAEQPREAPNFERWWFRCDALLQELGGYCGELFFFEDPTRPKPPTAGPSPGDPDFIGPIPEFVAPSPPVKGI